MIAEIATLFASFHPYDPGMNDINPGLLGAISTEWHPHAVAYLTGGVYRDSYSKQYAIGGGGFRVSYPYGGVDIAILKTHGSHLAGWPVFPVPSVFVGANGCFAQVSLFGRAVGFSARFELATF